MPTKQTHKDKYIDRLTAAIAAHDQRLADEVREFLSSTRGEAISRRQEARAATGEVETLKAALAAAESDRDGWKQKYEAAPDETKAELEQLRGTIREGKHKSAFAAACKEAGIRDEAVEDLYQLTKYTPEGDEPDGEKLKTLIGEAATARPYLVAGRGETPTPITPPAPKAGPAVRRGEPDTSLGRFRVSATDTTDPEWMRANGARFAAAQSDGSLHWVG